jgi:hypothetical protein
MLDRDDRYEQGDDDADADDVQLDQTEDATDREAGGGSNDCCPTMPGDHLSTGGHGYGVDDFADDGDARDSARHGVGAQHEPV